MSPLSMAAWALTYLLHSTLFLGATWILFAFVARGAAHRARDRVWKLALVAGLATATLQVGLGLEPLGGRFALQHDVAPAEPTHVQPPSRAPAPAPSVIEERRPSLDEARPHARPAKRSTAEQDKQFPVHLVRAHASDERFLRASSSTEVETEAPFRSSVAARPERSTATVPALQAEQPSLVGGKTGRGFDALAALFGLAWALGIAVAVTAIAAALLRLERGLRGRRPVRSGVAVRLLDDLTRRAGLSRNVELSVSDTLTTPLTFGLLRPEICVPARALDALVPDQLEAMLAHELGHAVRRDPLWQFVARGIASVLFFQPLNRIAAAELADAAEYLSDDWAVAHTGRRLSLASCLTEVATWIVGARRPLPAPGMADGKRRLGRRVHRLLEEDGETGSVGTGRLAGSCAAALVAGVLVVPGFAASAGASTVPPAQDCAPSELESEPVAPQESESESESDSEPEAVATVLEALDLQVALLEKEVGALRAAVLALDEPDALLDSLRIIERRIARLRERRGEFTRELSRLARAEVGSH